MLITVSVYIGVEIGKRQLQKQTPVATLPTDRPENSENNEGQKLSVAPVKKEFKELKTYKNNQFGFTLDYPKYGQIQDPDCFEAGGTCGPNYDGECGGVIRDYREGILIDSLAYVVPKYWSGTIENFMQEKDPKGITKFVRLPQKDGRVESVEIVGFEPSKIDQEEGYSPFAYTNYIFKKGNIILEFQALPQALKDGCVLEGVGGWKIADNFSFID